MWIENEGPLNELPPNKSLDASGGSVFLNLLDAAEGALIRAAASTQPLGIVGDLLMRPNLHDILHRRLYVTLTLCVMLLILTLLFSRFSFVYISVGLAVGL